MVNSGWLINLGFRSQLLGVRKYYLKIYQLIHDHIFLFLGPETWELIPNLNQKLKTKIENSLLRELIIK
jgi:hypothetical protein